MRRYHTWARVFKKEDAKGTAVRGIRAKIDRLASLFLSKAMPTTCAVLRPGWMPAWASDSRLSAHGCIHPHANSVAVSLCYLPTEY